MESFISIALPESLDPKTYLVLRDVLAQLDGILGREHNIDGTHGNITARSINVEPNTELDVPTEDAALSLFGTEELTIIGMGVATHTTVYTEGKSTIRIELVTVGGGAATITYFKPGPDIAPRHGEMFLLYNASTEYIALIHSTQQYGMRLPRDANYFFAPNVSMVFRYDGTSSSWRPFHVAGTQLVGDIFLRLGACPPGSTELTAFDGQFLRGGLAAAAGTSGGAANHTHSVSITSGAGGAHTPAGSVSGSGTTDSGGSHQHTGSTDSNGAHTHGFGGTTDSDGAHTHDYTGTTDGGDLTAVVSFDFASGGDGTIWAWNSDVGTNSHDHDYGGTTQSSGAHTHTFSGTTGSSGAHTHGFTTDSGGAHTHTFSLTSTFTGTPVADHTHAVSGTTGNQSDLPPWTKVVLCQHS